MLNSKTKYALKALIYLASRPASVPVLISELATKERMPKKFLEQILLDLKAHGILQSRMGKGGGYLLRRRPEDISIGEVVRIMDGPLAPVSCVSQTAYMPCKECNNEAACGIRSVMKEVRDAIADILDGTNLTELLKRSENAQREANALMYEI